MFEIWHRGNNFEWHYCIFCFKFTRWRHHSPCCRTTCSKKEPTLPLRLEGESDHGMHNSSCVWSGHRALHGALLGTDSLATSKVPLSMCRSCICCHQLLFNGSCLLYGIGWDVIMLGVNPLTTNLWLLSRSLLCNNCHAQNYQYLNTAFNWY